MLSLLIGFIAFVVVTFIVGALLELPPKVTLFGFAIGVWWLFF
tara:strand:+ start:10514 stop:10642 length:129 start_codon:yes stop_codon:yes gene_type:complete